MADMPYDDSPNLIAYKVRELAKTAANLVVWQKDVDKTLDDHENALSNVSDGFKDLKGEVAGMRKALVGFALSIAGSSVVFSLSILAATGKI